jgi:hypothetical protein
MDQDNKMEQAVFTADLEIRATKNFWRTQSSKIADFKAAFPKKLVVNGKECAVRLVNGEDDDEFSIEVETPIEACNQLADQITAFCEQYQDDFTVIPWFSYD